MRKLQFETTFEKEKLTNLLNHLNSGSLNEILSKVVVTFLPTKQKAKEDILKLSKTSPMQYLLARAIQDKKGRTVATIGSIESDLPGHIVKHISNLLSFSAPVLNLALNKLTDESKIEADDLLSFINTPLIFESEKIKIVKKGLEYYLKREYLESVHLLIPQFEEALRNMYESMGGVVLKPYKEGKFQLVTLDEILREPILIETLGEDLCLYYQVLFTDQRGWNVRNQICHGIFSADSINPQTADRILHAFLCFGMFQKVPG
jgi:hypothetical protein